MRDLVEAADRVTQATKRVVKLVHPDDMDLAFLYGTILTDGNDGQWQQVTSLAIVLLSTHSLAATAFT